MTDLRERLEVFCEGFDETAAPIGIDEVFEERVGGESVRVVQPRLRVRRPLPGWAVAVIAALLVIAIAAVGFLVARGSGDVPFVDDDTVRTTPVPALVEAGSGVDAASELVGDDWPYRGYPERLGDGTWVVFEHDWGGTGDEVVWILGDDGEWTPHETAEFGADVSVPFREMYVRAGLLWALLQTPSPEVWNSADGLTWRRVGFGDATPPAFQPRIARADDSILMGGAGGGTLYVSSDAGRSFEAIAPFPGDVSHLWHTGEEFRAIVRSTDPPGMPTLWRSPHGVAWEQVGRVSGLGVADVGWRSALSSSPEAVLVGDLDLSGTTCHGDVYRSVDGGSTWQAVGIVDWLTDGGPSFLRPACWSVASADGEWMLVGGYAAWGPSRAGMWGSRNGVDWYRFGSGFGSPTPLGSYPVVDTDLAPPLEP